MTEQATSHSPGKSMDDIVALCRRRGFIFQSSEIYGGINGFWDYGPLGVLLKRNLKDAWWQDIITCPPDGPDGNPLQMVGLDSTIIMNPKVWVASGHVGGFNDPMTMCKECKKLLRADQVWFVFYGNPDEIGRYSEDLTQSSNNTLGSIYTELLHRESLSPAERQRLANEDANLEQASRETKGQPFLLEKGVIAGSQEEAFEAGEFTAKQRKAIEKHGAKPLKAISMMAPDPVWPNDHVCPVCEARDSLTEPRQFNLMFESHAGPIKDESNKVYLRPETAQGIFTQFWNVVDTSRVRVPFGIAQVGKAFRNEVTPRNFTFRSREFEQMEIEFFIHPSEADQWYAYWRDMRFNWWKSIGLAGDNLTLREHDRDELAHYAQAGAGTSDIEYRFPFTSPGFGELEGVAHRTDFDLRQHAEHSGMGDKLRYFDQERNERYFPHVIEPSAGADRGTLAVLCEAYTLDDTRPSKVYMNFHPRLAPIKAAIFPLVNKDGMPEVADKLYRKLRTKYAVQTDAKQSIGKRYARMDEAGTPYCFTIDGQTLEDQTVTVRDRDTQSQERIALDKVEAFLAEKIGG